MTRDCGIRFFGIGDQRREIIADGPVGGGAVAFGGRIRFPVDALEQVKHVPGAAISPIQPSATVLNRLAPLSGAYQGIEVFNAKGTFVPLSSSYN